MPEEIHLFLSVFARVVSWQDLSMPQRLEQDILSMTLSFLHSDLNGELNSCF